MEIFFAGANTVLMVLFLQAFLAKKRNVRISIKIAIIFAVLIARTFTGLFFNENLIAITGVSTLSTFIVAFVFFNNKIHVAAIATFFTVLSGAISELIAAFLVTGFQEVPFAEMAQFNLIRLQGTTLSMLIMLIIIVLVRCFRKGSIHVMATKITLTLCVMLIISMLAIWQYGLHLLALPYAPTTNEIIPIFSIAMMNVFIFTISEILVRQNEKAQKMLLIETQNAAHQTHIKQLTQNHDQIRTMSHDFKQQVQELYTLCVGKQYDELLAKLSELSSRRSDNMIVETGNIMLDSILTSKIETAETQKINFKRKLDVQAELDYINSEVCVLLGNALDNAIEACMRADNDTDKFIGMELTATPKQFLCHIINTIGIMPQADGEFLKTAKDDSLHHGIGLQSMAQICDDIGGTLTYSYDEKHFNLWIKITIN